jgi:DNA-3-methyladenine glycosylase II
MQPKCYSLHVTLPEPFNFALTVAKPAGWSWSTPKEIFEAGTLWTAVRVRDMPVGLRMSARKNRVQVRAYTESPLTREDANDLQEMLRVALGEDEDLEGFYRFARDDPVLSQAVADHPGMRIGLLDDVFGGVILAILLQMAPIARSEKMMDAVLELAGTKVVFDGKEVVLWPRAEEIAKIDPGILRKKALLGYRAGRLIKAAQYLAGHPISLRDLTRLPEEEAVKILTAILVSGSIRLPSYSGIPPRRSMHGAWSS